MLHMVGSAVGHTTSAAGTARPTARPPPTCPTRAPRPAASCRSHPTRCRRCASSRTRRPGRRDLLRQQAGADLLCIAAHEVAGFVEGRDLADGEVQPLHDVGELVPVEPVIETTTSRRGRPSSVAGITSTPVNRAADLSTPAWRRVAARTCPRACRDGASSRWSQSEKVSFSGTGRRASRYRHGTRPRALRPPGGPPRTPNGSAPARDRTRRGCAQVAARRGCRIGSPPGEVLTYRPVPGPRAPRPSRSCRAAGQVVAASRNEGAEGGVVRLVPSWPLTTYRSTNRYGFVLASAR